MHNTFKGTAFAAGGQSTPLKGGVNGMSILELLTLINVFINLLNLVLKHNKK